MPDQNQSEDLVELRKEIEELQSERTALKGQIINQSETIADLEYDLTELEEQLQQNNNSTDDPEDCRRSLFFALKEFEEVERGEVSLTDKLFDLRMRHCKFL